MRLPPRFPQYPRYRLQPNTLLALPRRPAHRVAYRMALSSERHQVPGVTETAAMPYVVRVARPAAAARAWQTAHECTVGLIAYHLGLGYWRYHFAALAALRSEKMASAISCASFSGSTSEGHASPKPNTQ